MVRNTLVDLHNILMEALERLNDDELEGDDLDNEIKRTKQITEVGKVICTNTSNMIQAQKLAYEAGLSVDNKTQRVLIGRNNNEDQS